MANKRLHVKPKMLHSVYFSKYIPPCLSNVSHPNYFNYALAQNNMLG